MASTEGLAAGSLRSLISVKIAGPVGEKNYRKGTVRDEQKEQIQ
jgi:hypothetical protein